MSDNRCDWHGKHYAFFQNRECEYFPCHKTNDPEHFNCLFCYCPLYVLGPDCGGNPKYKNGIKVCTDCMLPHHAANYGYVTGRFREIAEALKKLEELKNPGESEEND